MCRNEKYAKLRVFILVLCLLQLGCCEDAEEVEDVEHEDEHEVEHEDEAVPHDQLDAKHCMKDRHGCCTEGQIDLKDGGEICILKHKDKIPPKGSEDRVKDFKFIACFADCLYKHKKYIAKGNNVNMKAVKSDADKLFADKPKEKEYYIEMFDKCRKEAKTQLQAYNKEPSFRAMVKTSCKPYATILLNCLFEYSKKYSCPYFTWLGKANTDAEEDCKLAKSKCYEIDGIQE